MAMHEFKPFDSAQVLRDARRAADLTQRELAARAGTSQSVVARIESGQTNPTAATLERFLAAAGFELWTELTPKPVRGSHMLDDMERILALSPTDRLVEVRNLARFDAATGGGR